MTKNEYKEALERFKDQTAYIHKATIDSIIRESSDAQETRIKKLLRPENYALMFDYYFGKDTPIPMADSPCAWYHTAAYRDLYKNNFITLFNFVFRGGAKSTHANMGYAFGLKQSEIMKFFLVVGANEIRAKMLLADLQAQFEANNRIINDFGKQISYGNWADGQFETNDRCTFMALGIDQPFRGLRQNGVRLQYVSVDDVEDPKKALNRRLVDELANKLTGDLELAFSKDSQRMIINNNYFTDKGIMAELMKRKGVKLPSTKQNLVKRDKYTSLYLVNLTENYPQSIGGDANIPLLPSWHERYSVADCERLIEKYEHDKPTLIRELYNTPFEVGKLFKTDWIRFVKPKKLSEYKMLIGHWDFSYSATGDTKAFGLIGVDDGRYTLLDVYCRRGDIEDAFEYHYTRAKEVYKQNQACMYYYDASVAQRCIYEPLLWAASTKHKSFHIPMPEHSQTDKYIRIEATLTSVLSSGKLVFSEDLKSNPDWDEARLQLLGFEKGAKINDDFPDTLEAVVRLTQQFDGETIDSEQLSKPVFGKWKRGGY